MQSGDPMLMCFQSYLKGLMQFYIKKNTTASFIYLQIPQRLLWLKNKDNYDIIYFKNI